PAPSRQNRIDIEVLLKLPGMVAVQQKMLVGWSLWQRLHKTHRAFAKPASWFLACRRGRICAGRVKQVSSTILPRWPTRNRKLWQLEPSHSRIGAEMNSTGFAGCHMSWLGSIACGGTNPSDAIPCKASSPRTGQSSCGTRSHFPQKPPFCPLFGSFYPHFANQSALRAAGGQPLSGTQGKRVATFALVTTVGPQPCPARSTPGEPGRAADRQAFASLSYPVNRQVLRNPHVGRPGFLVSMSI